MLLQLPQLHWGVKKRWFTLMTLFEQALQRARWFMEYWFERAFVWWYFPQLMVQAGPFGKLRYPRYPHFQEIFSTFVPKLAGAYEVELHPFMKKLKNSSFTTIINIGSDDGYYAIGLGSNKSAVKLVFFEPNRSANQYAKLFALENGISRTCCRFEENPNPAKLQKSLTPKSLVICDCEGAELDYMDPVRVPALATATMLVEVHDAINPVISKTLKKRFSKSHDITTIPAKSQQNYANLYVLMTQNEKRAAAVFWLYFKPRGLS